MKSVVYEIKSGKYSEKMKKAIIEEFGNNCRIYVIGKYINVITPYLNKSFSKELEGLKKIEPMKT